ncbi:uncharacterized protein OCT59_010417 [Rhizophagus irregularis]|nr:hypothetical protein OCT59_010417 [Rhizophagus irregularis]GBC30046.2 hypothetical protein GLOIN_2v1479259 [Rhizophagus irregularis DAOM 181602=DAOM 197198]
MSLQKLLLKNLKVHPLFFYKLKPSSIPVDRRYYFNPICNGINRNECVYFNSVETRSNHWSPNDVCNFLKKELKEKWTPDLKDIILSQRISGKDLKSLNIERLESLNFPTMTFFNIIDIIKNLNSKTIFIQDYGEDGNLLETFKKIVFHSDTEIQDFLNLVQGKGFVEIIDAKGKKLPIEEKPPSIVNIEMQDNLIEFHFISKIKYESTWTETEDKAMKEETLLAIMEALNKYESDKILIAGERMYLVEAEHNITLENINNLSDEIKEFKKLKKNDVSSEYHELLDKLMIEGIICGVNFPKEFRKMAKDRGLYPGGGRYKVRIPYDLNLLNFSENHVEISLKIN